MPLFGSAPKTIGTVICVIKYKDKLLLLKRAVKPVEGKWEFPSNPVHSGEKVEDAVLRIIKEATGLAGKIKKQGKYFEMPAKSFRWILTPFLVSVGSDKVKLSPEHSEFKWVKPEEIENFNCVPYTKLDLANLKKVELL